MNPRKTRTSCKTNSQIIQPGLNMSLNFNFPKVFSTWNQFRIFFFAVCKRTCVSKSALGKHLLIHTQDKPYECVHCHKHFKQKSHVNYHVKMVHGSLPKDRPRNHICFHCGSAFTTASTLKKHVKTHTLEKPHLCKYCGKCFIQKVHLQTHLLRHSGDRPWVRKIL